MSLFSFLFSLVYMSSALSLIPNKEISCRLKSNEALYLKVEARDQYLSLQSGEIFEDLEFLDRAVLFRSLNDEKKGALFHLAKRNQAIFIRGPLVNFSEPDCKGGASQKKCSLDWGLEIGWSPLKISVKSAYTNLEVDVLHYGVYPNDGTFFIGESQGKAIAIIDRGSQLKIVWGELRKLRCYYSK